MFWRKYLSEVPVMDFPDVRADLKQGINTTAHKSFLITSDVQKLVSRYLVSPATSLYAAAAIVLGAPSSSEDVSLVLRYLVGIHQSRLSMI